MSENPRANRGIGNGGEAYINSSFWRTKDKNKKQKTCKECKFSMDIKKERKLVCLEEFMSNGSKKGMMVHPNSECGKFKKDQEN